MTAPIERLRAVLAAPGLPRTVEEVDPRGLLPRSHSRALAVLGQLGPALLAVVEAGRVLTQCEEHADACCIEWCAKCQDEAGSQTQHAAALDALDAAIAAALPETP